jgi:quinol monooxygenase YgiN
MCSIHPYFTILDEEQAKPIMEDFVKRTKMEKGCIYYGWDLVGDQLYCREAYVNAAAVLKHLENVAPCIDAILAGPAKLDRIEFHGPASELAKLQETADKLGAKCFAVDMGISFMVEENGAEAKNFGLCTIQPYFTVLDMERAKPIMQEFVEQTAKEKSCVYYGWTMDGDKLFCREAYLDAEGVLQHLENVGPCIEKILASGVCKLDSIEFHGPQADLDRLREKADALGAKCYATDSGFQRFEQTAQQAPMTLGSTGAMCSIHPYFTIVDKSKAKDIMEEFVTKTNSEKGCIFYGWDLDGDNLFCREAYLDASAVLAHLENVSPCIDKLLAGPAKLQRIEFHGPSSELAKLKHTADKLGAKLFATDKSISFLEVESSAQPVGFAGSAQTLVTIHPYFTVCNLEKAKPIMSQFVEKTKKEKGCLYYGWTMEGDKLFCQEGYVDADAVLRHLDNVGGCIGELLADGVAKLDCIEFHGPQAELHKLQEKASALGAKLYVNDSGFQKCSRK